MIAMTSTPWPLDLLCSMDRPHRLSTEQWNSESEFPMATVLVKMNFCGFTHRVTVTMNSEGNLDVDIESPCEHVRDFAVNLGRTITMDDVTVRDGSRLFDPEVVKPLTLTCLVPNGVLNAAWLETGMMSRSMAKKVGGDEISYEVI